MPGDRALYLREKSQILKFGNENAFNGKGNAEERKKNHYIKFQLGSSLEKMRDVMKKVTIFLETLNEKAIKMETNQEGPFADYIHYVEKTFDYLTKKGKKIIFACQPKWCDTVQQRMVRQLVYEKYQDQVNYVRLEDSVEKNDKSLWMGGWHLSAKGNYKLAKAILPHLNKALNQENFIP